MKVRENMFKCQKNSCFVFIYEKGIQLNKYIRKKLNAFHIM